LRVLTEEFIPARSGVLAEALVSERKGVDLSRKENPGFLLTKE